MLAYSSLEFILAWLLKLGVPLDANSSHAALKEVIDGIRKKLPMVIC